MQLLNQSLVDRAPFKDKFNTIINIYFDSEWFAKPQEGGLLSCPCSRIRVQILAGLETCVEWEGDSKHNCPLQACW